MSWIEIIDEKNANKDLKQVYEELLDRRGKIANILKVQSLLPDTMRDHLHLYLHIMFNHSSIKREDKELIAVYVSLLNNCSYCVNHHAQALRSYWKKKELLTSFLSSGDITLLQKKQQILLSFVEKLTMHPDTMQQSDIEQLRDIDFDDTSVLEVVLIVSYFNFVNRMALGLGVSYTESEMKGYRY